MIAKTIPLRPVALLMMLGSAFLMNAAAAEERKSTNWLTGTWYLALDTTPFGAPGFALSGIVIFNRDGTYQLQDAGDFGQATFIGKRHSTQYGAWRYKPRGRAKGTALFLEAELNSGEVERWQKVQLYLKRTRDRHVVKGTVNVSILECPNMLPVPTALTCPDPVEEAANFVALPPGDVEVTLRRIRPGS